MRRIRAFAVLLPMSVLALVAVSEPRREGRWWKGNTHTHTLWSDGDAAPEQVADEYRQLGHHFLVLSDHNVLLEGEKWKRLGAGKGELPPPRVEALVAKYGREAVELREREGATWMRLRTLEELRPRFEEPGRFLFIKGEEVTDRVLEAGVEKPVHHNAMNHTHLLKPPGGTSVREVLERTIRAVEEEARRAGRPVLVHLNHPNFHWGVSPDDLAHVLGERFFEVYNGHRGVRNHGDEEHLSTERLWDYVLTIRLGRLGGPPLFGLATDDAHNYHKKDAVANAGRGWIWVRAPELSAEAILRAMMDGDFYASSGVRLEDVRRGEGELSLRIAAEPGVTYTTRFIGTRKGSDRTGEVLAEVAGDRASYRLQGDELYVRATVVSSRKHPNGYDAADLESAWVQPLVGR
jgi:hypothetical protein